MSDDKQLKKKTKEKLWEMIETHNSSASDENKITVAKTAKKDALVEALNNAGKSKQEVPVKSQTGEH